MTIADEEYTSEQAFVEPWGARATPGGDLYSPEEVVSLPPAHVWTVSEGEEPDEEGVNVDGNWYATPGVSVVNAIS